MNDFAALKEKHLAALERRVAAITSEPESTLSLTDQVAIIEALDLLARERAVYVTAIVPPRIEKRDTKPKGKN